MDVLDHARLTVWRLDNSVTCYAFAYTIAGDEAARLVAGAQLEERHVLLVQVTRQRAGGRVVGPELTPGEAALLFPQQQQFVLLYLAQTGWRCRWRQGRGRR